MAKVPLLNRGYLVPPADMSELKRREMMTMIPRDYIIQEVKRADPPRTAGDRVFVIKAGTGSGKSITIPASFLWRGRRIGVTEPTKLITEEVTYDIPARNPEIRIGENIGYQTGTVNKMVSRGIMIMTPGILFQHLNTMTPEQIMRTYSTWIIDEVHRHDLTNEFLLRACRTFIEEHWANPDCPVLVLMSATIEPRDYAEYFGTTHVIEVAGAGGAYDIKEVWPDAAVENLETAIVAHARELKGDSLIFVPTVKTMHSIRDALGAMPGRRVVEIYSEVLESSSEARSLQQESKEDRIILATNVAEAGVTFGHLQNCVDTGYAYIAAFNPQINARVSYVGAASKASAQQRRGRVGRRKPGVWYPLYTREVFAGMLEQSYPDVYIQDISDMLLRYAVMQTGAKPADDLSEMKYGEGKMEVGTASGTAFDPTSMRLMHSPSGEMIQHCMEKLYTLGFIDTQWRPTVSGWIASRFTTLGVQEARLILSGYRWGAEIIQLIIIACASTVGSGATSLGILPNTYGLIDSWIDLLLTYEEIRKKITIAERGADLSIRFLEQWFEERELNYNGWLNVLALIDETVLQLIACGLPVRHWDKPPRLTDDLDRRDTSGIGPIKHCICEAFRTNMAAWNSKSETYVTDSHGQQLKAKIEASRMPNVIVTNIVEYGRGGFKAGAFVSAMDGWVDIDKKFLY